MENNFIVKNITEKNILLSDIPNAPLLQPDNTYNLSGCNISISDLENSMDLRYALSRKWLEKIDEIAIEIPEEQEKTEEKEIPEEQEKIEENCDNLEEILNNYSRKEILDIVRPTMSESASCIGVHNVDDLYDLEEDDDKNIELEEYKKIWVIHQELEEKLDEIRKNTKENNIIIFNKINQLSEKIDKINPEKQLLIKKLSQLEYDKENLNQQLKEKEEEIEKILTQIKLKDSL